MARRGSWVSIPSERTVSCRAWMTGFLPPYPISNSAWLCESPWVPWRLHTLERRMESCQQRRYQGSRPRGGTRQQRESKRSAWSVSSAPSSGPTTGRSHRVARQLGYGVESVRAWVRQADIDEGLKGGTTTEDAERIKELEQENRELRRANEILRKASAFFAGGARPPTSVMVAFIDEHRDELGVEPICKALQVAPSTYYAAKSRQPSATGAARRRPDAGADGAVGREPQGLRGPQALEGRPPRRPRHRPGPGRPPDA